MSTHRTPLNLIHRGLARPSCIGLADRNEALAGDILEGFQLKQSRLWFWRELVGAILTGGFRRSIEVRPIKLVEFPSLPSAHEDFAAKRIRLQTLGLSASPVNGISGWTIVTLIMLISALEPALWIMLVMGMGVGIAIGIGTRHLSATPPDQAWRGSHYRRALQPSRAEVRPPVSGGSVSVRIAAAVCAASLCAVPVSAIQAPKQAVPLEPVGAIIDAFSRAPVVTLPAKAHRPRNHRPHPVSHPRPEISLSRQRHRRRVRQRPASGPDRSVRPR